MLQWELMFLLSSPIREMLFHCDLGAGHSVLFRPHLWPWLAGLKHERDAVMLVSFNRPK